MSLAKVNEILNHATENKYGVAATNVFNYETVKWAVMAAEREKMPIIIQLYPGFKDFINLKYIAYIAKDMAENASVPIGVHLDHSATFEIAVGGIKDGFTSVMIDGSVHDYDINAEMTKAVVDTARVFGVDVEAELGHVGSGDNLDDIVNSDNYTNVEEAVKFQNYTGCGSLAVAVGNAHGAYIKTPNLDFDRIKKLREALDIPLVLHGCSDIPNEQLQESVRLGMSKFNIATEYFRACYASAVKDIPADLKDGNLFGMMSQTAHEGAIEFVQNKIKLLNPNNFKL